MIWETVKKISADKTVIIVEHKIEHVADFIDRVIVFDNAGTIIADGAPGLVFASYKNEFQKNGIWFPGLWEQYKADRPVSRKLDLQNKKHIVLENFKGFRKKDMKIHIDSAVAESGDWIVVTGKNGAGKSTMLLSLIQLLTTTGTYEIDGRMIHRNKDVAKDAAFVFQNPEFQFVANTVYDELAFTFRQKNEDANAVRLKVSELLLLFRLADKQDLHPYQLSIGQKRRLSVATAFAQNPFILLLDEPTFGQDSQNTFALLELLEKYRASGCIIIMATHDRHIIEHFATKVWNVIDGKVTVEETNFEEDETEISAEAVHAYTI